MNRGGGGEWKKVQGEEETEVDRIGRYLLKAGNEKDKRAVCCNAFFVVVYSYLQSFQSW